MAIQISGEAPASLTIENMTPRMYEGAGYYERWVRAMRDLLIEKGVLNDAEIAARLEAVRARYGKPVAPQGAAPSPPVADPQKDKPKAKRRAVASRPGTGASVRSKRKGGT